MLKMKKAASLWAALWRLPAKPDDLSEHIEVEVLAPDHFAQMMQSRSTLSHVLLRYVVFPEKLVSFLFGHAYLLTMI